MAQMYIDNATEIRSLNNILVLPTKDYQCGWKAGTHVSFTNILTYGGVSNFNYILKQDENKHYLIVVNKDTRTVSNTQITVSGLIGNMTAITLGHQTSGSSMTGRSISVNNGTFTDSFDGLAVHIYRIE